MPLPVVFATIAPGVMATGLNLDQDFNAVGLLGTIPCSVSGTNTLTMTPAVPVPPIVLQPQIRFSGIAAHSNTGAVNAVIAGLPSLNVYKDGPSGPVALTGNEIIIGNYFTLTLDAALNSNAGGYHLSTATVTAAGTVTSVATGAGLAGGTITTTGTVALATVADHSVIANISGGALAPAANTLTAILDSVMGSTQGMLLARGASVWSAVGETAWTPVLAFAGVSTGITYGTQVGQYYALGRAILAMFNVVLTNKGSATGAATLSLPVTGGGTNRIGSAIVSNYNNLGAVPSQPFGSIAASGTTVALYQAGTGTNTALLDSDFANNTTLSGWMIYLSG